MGKTKTFGDLTPCSPHTRMWHAVYAGRHNNIQPARFLCYHDVGCCATKGDAALLRESPSRNRSDLAVPLQASLQSTDGTHHNAQMNATLFTVAWLSTGCEAATLLLFAPAAECSGASVPTEDPFQAAKQASTQQQPTSPQDTMTARCDGGLSAPRVTRVHYVPNVKWEMQRVTRCPSG